MRKRDTAGCGTVLFAAPMMIAVQELAQRIALQTGVGMGTALRRKFPVPVVAAAVALLVLSNIIIIGADLQAIAAGIELLTHGWLHASWLIVAVAVVDIATNPNASPRLTAKVYGGSSAIVLGLAALCRLADDHRLLAS